MFLISLLAKIHLCLDFLLLSSKTTPTTNFANSVMEPLPLIVQKSRYTIKVNGMSQFKGSGFSFLVVCKIKVYFTFNGILAS